MAGEIKSITIVTHDIISGTDAIIICNLLNTYPPAIKHAA